MTDQPALPQDESSSYSTILTNIFAAPSEAFSPIAGTPPRTLRWLIPLVCLMVLAMGVKYITATNPTFKGQMMEIKLAGIDRFAEKGWIPPERAEEEKDKIRNEDEKPSVLGIVGTGLMPGFMFFVSALFLWIGAKIGLKTPAGYGKHMEIFGLACWIGIIGGIVTMIMMIAFDTMYASPSASIIVLGSFDPMNTMHRFLSVLNAFEAWQAVVAGIGIATIAGKGALRGIIVSVILWMLWIGVQMSFSLLF